MYARGPQKRAEEIQIRVCEQILRFDRKKVTRIRGIQAHKKTKQKKKKIKKKRKKKIKKKQTKKNTHQIPRRQKKS